MTPIPLLRWRANPISSIDIHAFIYVRSIWSVTSSCFYHNLSDTDRILNTVQAFSCTLVDSVFFFSFWLETLHWCENFADQFIILILDLRLINDNDYFGAALRHCSVDDTASVSLAGGSTINSQFWLLQPILLDFFHQISRIWFCTEASASHTSLPT